MKVCVLLSTYNGERYLQEQIASVRAQVDVNVCLIVRDDGSIDSTAELLSHFQNEHQLKLIPGGINLGPAISFLKLLESAPNDCQYFAFCDQDDVWQKDKLARAASALAPFGEQVPVMYCSRLEIVDSNLQSLGLSRVPTRIGFGNAMVENVATGCTMVLNKRARSLILSDLPDQCDMHDWWIYLVISCFGKVIYDPTPTIRYRQHGENAVGTSINMRSELVKRIGRFKKRSGGVFRSAHQAGIFLEYYGVRIPVDKADLIRKFIRGKNCYFTRLSLALSGQIWRQRRVDGIVLRILILLNRY